MALRGMSVSLFLFLSRTVGRVKRPPLLTYSRAMGNKTPTASSSKEAVFKKGEVPPPKITFTEKELRERLTEEEYNITQGKGTERAFTGKYVNVEEDGEFNCVVCGYQLFKSDKKFESGSGWPSFSDVAKQGHVNKIIDDSAGMARTEVVCGQCNAHLGHVFNDGPAEETGLRYCINSASLKFDPKGASDKGTVVKPSDPQDKEATPETSDPQDKEATPETSDPQDKEATPETSDPQDKEATPETSDPQDKEATPETSDPQDKEATPETSDPQDKEATPETSDPQDKEATPETSDPHDKEATPETSDPQDKEATPETSDPQDKEATPETSDPQDKEATPETSDPQDKEATPETSDPQDDK